MSAITFPFLNENHIKRFNELYTKHINSGGKPDDGERMPLFFILSAFSDIFELAPRLYDFETKSIKTSMLNKFHFDYDSHRELVRLGFNLFNSICKCNITDVICYCGANEREVLVTAISIRSRVTNIAALIDIGKVYIDEQGKTVTEAELHKEFNKLREEQPDEYTYSFEEYIENCISKNGTLKKAVD